MSKLSYFQSCATKQEAKQTFRELAKKFHPDKNKEVDTTAIMKAIIAEYESIVKTLPSESSDNIHTDNMSESEFSAYVTAEMKNIIDNISHLPLTIEIIGTWIWVSGNTYPYKSYLTAYNFTWCAKKRMYSWHMGQYKKYGKTKDIEEIRNTYGTTKVNNKYRAAIA